MTPAWEAARQAAERVREALTTHVYDQESRYCSCGCMVHPDYASDHLDEHLNDVLPAARALLALTDEQAAPEGDGALWRLIAEHDGYHVVGGMVTCLCGFSDPEDDDDGSHAIHVASVVGTALSVEVARLTIRHDALTEAREAQTLWAQAFAKNMHAARADASRLRAENDDLRGRIAAALALIFEDVTEGYLSSAAIRAALAPSEPAPPTDERTDHA